MEKEKYRVVNGTFYHKTTPREVVDILEESRINGTRLKIFYGDIKTGRPWGDIEICRVGRSNGQIKIPLAIKNKRSLGGESLLDDCIIKIQFSNKKNGELPLFNISK